MCVEEEEEDRIFCCECIDVSEMDVSCILDVIDALVMMMYE